MASFSAPSQIYLVIKLRVYRRLPLDCLGFKLNLSPIIKRFMSSAPKMKLPTQKTNIGDFNFKIAIHQLIKSFIIKFLAFLAEWQSPLTACLAITK